jgi:ArsR family transcriptional regulator
MDKDTRARLAAQAEVFKALGHPTRVFIVQELARGERCVCELTEMVRADKSTVSKHLSILKRAGILADEKRGTMVFYSLRTPCVLQFMTCVRGMLNERAAELAALHG